MSQLPSEHAPDRQGEAEAAITPEIPLLRVSDDSIEARARMCFRALSLCLAAMVLVLTTLGLHAVISGFVSDVHAGQYDAPHATPASLDTATDVDATNGSPAQAWPHAVVAVISILLIGEVVLAIGLVRATFSMKVNTDVPSTPEKETSSAGGGLPGIELLKAATDTIEMVLKGLPKR
ncbi:hypothetical protein [Roseateles sp. UC29_93]|uniref:hypothetical protein n=1 Tax=Roseateles TaxID=93681 RepID=UPI0036715553